MESFVKSFTPAARPLVAPAPWIPRVVPVQPKALPICAYEGQLIAFCGRGDDGHLRHCDHPKAEWDNCRRTFGGPSEQSCNTCPLHSRHEIGRTRHLVYFVCPLAGNNVWQWNVEQLVKRIDLFNGKRIIGIATGSPIHRPRMRPARLDAPDKVQAMFPPGCEFLTFQNDPNLGEMVAWESLWNQIPRDGVTFYAHAKGVKHGAHPTIPKWTQAMYETCLDDWPAVETALQTHAMAGTFKKLGYCFQDNLPASQWHFSGSFYWARNADWFARGCHKFIPDRMASEAIPGIFFRPEEVAGLLVTAPGYFLNLYSEATWQTTVEAKYRAWLDARAVPA